eukprot:sb/3469778/
MLDPEADEALSTEFYPPFYRKSLLVLWSIFIILPTIGVSTPDRPDGNVAYFRYLPGQFINADHYSIMCGIRFSVEPSYSSGSYEFIRPTAAQKVVEFPRESSFSIPLMSPRWRNNCLDKILVLIWGRLQHLNRVLSIYDHVISFSDNLLNDRQANALTTVLMQNFSADSPRNVSLSSNSKTKKISDIDQLGPLKKSTIYLNHLSDFSYDCNSRYFINFCFN